MRVATSPKTGLTWRLCCWDDVCQMPVSTHLEDKAAYCRWHQRCLQMPQQAGNFETFTMFLDWCQGAYPSRGWWGWPAEQLWPVLQGVETVWQAEALAA